MVKIVTAEVTGNNEQVAFQILVLIGTGIFNETKEYLLRNIVGIRRLSRQVKAEAVDFVVVPVRNDVERFLAAVMHFSDQFFICHVVFPVLSGVCLNNCFHYTKD